MNPNVKSVLTGSGGGLSSKRVALFLFIFAFFTQCGMAYAKMFLPDTLRDELFYTMQGLIVAVFGEGAIVLVKGLKDRVFPTAETGGEQKQSTNQ